MGEYRYQPEHLFGGHKLNDYIERAGGYNKDAARFQTFIVYPDGTSKSNDLLQLSSLKVYDGSEIIIPNKVKTDKFLLTQYASNLTELWADITQAWLMIHLALRN